MLLQSDNQALDVAEEAFRAAFIRLKTDEPEILPKGSKVSQANIAREAGCDPSALRKDRYPSLIQEIQTWIKINSAASPVAKISLSAQLKASRARNSELAARISMLEMDRDNAQSDVLRAHALILELSKELIKLRPESNVKDFEAFARQRAMSALDDLLD